MLLTHVQPDPPFKIGSSPCQSPSHTSTARNKRAFHDTPWTHSRQFRAGSRAATSADGGLMTPSVPGCRVSSKWLVSMHPEILGTHQWSFFAGLADLVRSGTVDLSFERLRSTSLRSAATTRVTDMESGRSLLVGWEMQDGAALDDWHVANVDVIIKRGFDDRNLSDYETCSASVIPMGLTLGCRSPGSTRLALRSNAQLTPAVVRRQTNVSVRQLLASWATLGRVGKVALARKHDPVVQELEAFYTGLRRSPEQRESQHVTFLARAWDPDGVNPLLRDDLREVTEERANLIRLLRSELGSRFIGGFVPSDYAAAHFSDCLAQVSTRRPDFLSCVAKGGIGISTRGLSDSNPWKLAEYSAMGTAIVSEPLVHRLPTQLAAGENILLFESNGECVEQCLKLLGDPELRARLQLGSAAYWDEHVQPGTLLRNRLIEAFDESGAR